MSTNEVPTTVEEPFAYLAPHQFVVLTTYRKDGTPVPTTIWFAYEGGNVYFTTQKQAGKVKRLRRNEQVKMIPSDRVGNVLDLPEVVGKGAELTAEEYGYAQSLLRQKYGAAFDEITANSDSALRTFVIIRPFSA